ELPQVLERVKSLALVPPSTTLLMANAALPVFVRVTVFVALVVCTTWSPNPRLAGLIERANVETGMLGPPAQELNRRAKRMQIGVRIAAFARRRFKHIANI